jgi:hypothetical protein
MISSRLTGMVLAAVLTVGCIPYGWAEDSWPVPEQCRPEQSGPSGGSIAAAVVSDIVYIPGKTVVCVTSGALWTVAMILSAGMIYKEAGDYVHDACTGKWVLTGEDFMGAEDKF